MLIDWFTVAAQAINFIILVWLLKRYLYRPILDAVDAREKLIAAQLADADSQRAQAQAERETFQHKNDEFDRQRADLLNKATQAASSERQRLFEEARNAADALAAKRRDALHSEAASLNQAIVRRTGQEVFAIARQTLADLASASLEQSAIELFTGRLHAMDDAAKQDLGAGFKTEPVRVRSAFDLPEAQRAALHKVLDEMFGADLPIRFETAPDLVSGIELVAGGRKIAWNIADYLARLQQGVDELLKSEAKRS